jgi:predicted RNA-binding protein YlxR (DUF448 family)
MERDRKSAMVRIAVCGGMVNVDMDARIQGRGGYLHSREECLTRFTRSKAKEFRSLRRRVGLDERHQIAELIRTRLDSKPKLE